MSRLIVHVDLDAFFASVEQRDNPALRGKPVVVGVDPKGGRGRGVVSTCSYEARQYGIHSAMPISTAYRKCPHAVFLPGNFTKYRQASDEVFRIFYDFTPLIEPISIDEAFLDITESCHLFGSPLNAGRQLKEQIKNKVGLTASVGIAPVKMVAKIASTHSKPDGLLQIEPEGVLDFLWPLAVEKLWGVGPKTQELLHRLGIATIGDIAGTRTDVLQDHLGEAGLHLYALANGQDDRPVSTEEEIKSVSHEHTFDKDTQNADEIRRTILVLSEKVSRRLRKNNLKGRTITVKIRLKGFKTYTRSQTLSQRTNFTEVIYQTALSMFDTFYQRGMAFRLIGVRVNQFADEYVQDSLFKNAAEEKTEKIHRVTDLIKDKFGEGAIHRAA